MNPRIKLDRQAILRLLDGYPVQVPTEVGLLEFEAVQSEWQPLRKVPLDPKARAYYVTAMGAEHADSLDIWLNDTYEVIAKPLSPSTADPSLAGWHLSIKRLDRAPIRNWRHFQQIKNEVCGPECEAVELFPRESRLADNANQYHLFVMPEGVDIPLGFPTGMVTIRPEDVASYNTMGGPGRQEPMQPGLTIGEEMQRAGDEQGLGTARDAVLRHVQRHTT